MKRQIALLFLIPFVLLGCAAKSSDSEDSMIVVNDSPGGGTNAFNPYMNKTLPNTRSSGGDEARMLDAMGAVNQTIEGEAAHRRNWREEIYPIVFGDKSAPSEIIVLLNFSSPDSEKVWDQVVEASKSLSPQSCKIAVFGRSKENYGTDLMGLAIWLAHSRKGQAMPYLTYALKKWNEVKAAQKRSGGAKNFTNEYDAVATSKDFPIHYGYISGLKPPIPANQELAVAKYCYDAGNVNMYQATQIERYYGIKSLPAVVANGRVLSKPTAASILAALK
ncbi:MAG: hypothetical protein HDQ93_00225 [Desulfovibrio sp.]|nr:hypothetical protein [Desulfovibrio sp.]